MKKRLKKEDRQLLQTGIFCALFLIVFLFGCFGGIILKYLIEKL